MKLAVLSSHAIQYQVPFFRKLAQKNNIDLTVYFCWDFGHKKSYDAQFGREIQWDIPLTNGYKNVLLNNYAPKPSSDFWGQINPGIIKELLGGGYDAVIIYGWNGLTQWMAYGAALLKGIKILVHAESPYNQEVAKKGLKVAIKKIILKRVFRFVFKCLYIGEENKKFYESYGVPPHKMILCPYAVENERFIKEAERMAPERGMLRKELGVNDEKVILFCGKLTAKKNPLDVLKAFEKIKTNKKALVFVGDGVLRPSLEEYVESRKIQNVHFVGFQNQTALAKFYTIADIFVLPSGIGETWGLVVNEAMLFGLPVIVSNMVGCGADLVRENENGFIFPVGESEVLATYCEELIASEEKRKAFGARSHAIIQAYNHEEDARAIVSALQ